MGGAVTTQIRSLSGQSAGIWRAEPNGEFIHKVVVHRDMCEQTAVLEASTAQGTVHVILSHEDAEHLGTLLLEAARAVPKGGAS